MKKTKFYKLVLPLGTVTMTAVPATLVVSCGKDAKKVAPTNQMNCAANALDDSNKNQDSTSATSDTSVSQTPDIIQNLPQTAKDIESKITTITPYSTTSLLEEARKIGNDALWRRGITNEALVQSASLVNAFAVFSGWDFEKDFLDKDPHQGFINIQNDGTEVSKMNPSSLDPEAKNILDFFRTIQPMTKQDFDSDKSLARSSTMVFNYGDIGGQIKRMGLSADMNTLYAHWEYLRGGQIDPSNKKTRSVSYMDYKNPGTEIVQLTNELSPIAIAKTVNVTVGTQIYPIIDKENEDAFKPYIELAIYKFLQLVIENEMILSSMIVDLPSEQLNIFNFLIEKYTKINEVTGGREITIDNNTLDAFWTAINNGSHNLQAVKAMLIGFDDTFNNDEIFKGMSGADGLFSTKFNVLSITTWAAEGNGVEVVAPNSGLDKDVQGFWTFQADKTLDENVKINTGFDTYAQYVSAK